MRRVMQTQYFINIYIEPTHYCCLSGDVLCRNHFFYKSKTPKFLRNGSARVFFRFYYFYEVLHRADRLVISPWISPFGFPLRLCLISVFVLVSSRQIFTFCGKHRLAYLFFFFLHSYFFVLMHPAAQTLASISGKFYTNGNFKKKMFAS